MDEYTTGQVARATGLSEKAVRMYVDRGLLDARRTSGDGPRLLDGGQVERARLVRLLRGVGLSLAEVGDVLAAPDPVPAFDAVWSDRRSALAASLTAGEYVRSALVGEPQLDVLVRRRHVPERLVLGTERRATLAELPSVLPEATGALFAVLRAADVRLAGHPYVELHERATEGYAARLTLRVPVPAAVRPPSRFALTTDDAHEEAYVALTAAEARDQERLVLVHDYLASGRALAGGAPAGDDREVYLPTWEAGGPGPVMEVAVPVAGRRPGA
ncbi:MerR family transcriptional regulator [Cellulosimicrobium sp. TH-20]|uniref:MerR family transcriptional regulator n=1 Tax=Cellulosimicrobium sp. TH-20 TaxID=1980001 RepID=UPI0015836626